MRTIRSCCMLLMSLFWLPVAVSQTVPPVCPTGFILTPQTGNASDVIVDISVANEASALGPLAPEGSNPDSPGGGNTISAELNNQNDLLVLDLGFLVPEGAPLILSLARDGGAAGNNTMASIGASSTDSNFTEVVTYGVGAVDFVSAGQDILERVTITAPAGGVRFLEFDTLNNDDLFVDGVEFSSICVSEQAIDLSLGLATPQTGFGVGESTNLTVNLENSGPQSATGVEVAVRLPAGVSLISNDSGSDFDPISGVWRPSQSVLADSSIALTLNIQINQAGLLNLEAEIVAADQTDLDSIPGNGVPAEDDFASLDIFGLAAPLLPPVCPAQFTAAPQLGNATAIEVATSIANPDSALGPLAPAGSNPDSPGGGNTISAELNNGADLLVLDLGILVPENAVITLSLARDGGRGGDNTMASISVSPTNTGFTEVLTYGVGAVDFVSAGQDILERVFIVIPTGGARFIQFDTLNNDDLFVDGVEFRWACVPAGVLQAAKTVEIFDPESQGLLAISGTDVVYTLTVTNTGIGPTDADSLFLVDFLPDEVIFFNGDADGDGPNTGAVLFEEIVPTGLAPFDPSQSVRFSSGNSPPADFDACDHIPLPGYDPAVRFVCFRPQGTMNAGDPDPSFSLSFRTRIR